MDDILKGMESQEVTALVVLDLSAGLTWLTMIYYWSSSSPVLA